MGGSLRSMWNCFFLILVTIKFEITIVSGKSEWVAIFMVTVNFVSYQKNGNLQNGDCGCKQSEVNIEIDPSF